MIRTDPKMEVKGMPIGRLFRRIFLLQGVVLAFILISGEAFSASQSPSAPSRAAKELGFAFAVVAQKVLPSVYRLGLKRR